MNAVERAAANLLRALAPLPNMTVEQAKMLCRVAMNPDLSSTEYATQMKLPRSNVQHQLQALAKRGLVDSVQDLELGIRWQEGGNRKSHSLSKLGQAVFAKKESNELTKGTGAK